jgi:hypothetical protein
MVQGESLQEISDSRKLWTMEGIGHIKQGDDPLCRSGTTQGTWASETRKTRYSTENPEGTDVQDEMLEGQNCVVTVTCDNMSNYSKRT